MKASLLISLVAVAAALSGCDSMSYRQYVIRSASTVDENSVAAALATTAANQTGLRERTSTSRVPKTIAFYMESVDHFPVSLGARVAGEDVVVDLSCFHPGPFDPKAFKAVDAVLSKELPQAFGERLLIDPKPRIPVP